MDLDFFIKHAARAFFASAWADQCEESGNARIISGKEIFDLLPTETDPAAINAARTLAFDLQRANSGERLETLCARAIAAARYGVLTPELFAHYCAMQSMGHGVGLFDYGIEDDVVSVPYVEFGQHSLERDYFKGGKL